MTVTVLSARVSVRVVEPSAFWVTSVLTPELPEDEPPELPPEEEEDPAEPADPEAPADEATRLLSPLAHITGLRSEPLEGGRCRVTLGTDSPDGDEVCREAFFAFSRAGEPILRMSTARANLEDTFIELTSSDAPAAADGEEAQA